MFIFNIKNLLLEILVFISILSSILVIIAKNPVISVIFLISLVLNAALYLIVKGLSFMGISYILIYLGAIIVLFLFVIMMINIKLTDILEIGYQYTKNIPLAITVSILFFYFFFFVLPSSEAIKSEATVIFFSSEASSPIFNNEQTVFYNFLKEVTISLNTIYFYSTGAIDVISETNYFPLLTNTYWPEVTLLNFNHISSVANSLYTYGAFWFLLTSFILLLAMIAPIYISKK